MLTDKDIYVVCHHPVAQQQMRRMMQLLFAAHKRDQRMSERIEMLQRKCRLLPPLIGMARSSKEKTT